MDFEFQSLGSREATVARVQMRILDTDFDAVGTSKRDPLDEDDAEVAVLLAYGRALETLGAKLIKRARGITKHHDDVRNYKQVQLEKVLSATTEAKKLPKNSARKSKVATVK